MLCTKEDACPLPDKWELLFLTPISACFSLYTRWTASYRPINTDSPVSLSKEGKTWSGLILSKAARSAIETHLITIFSTDANTAQLKFQFMLQIELLSSARYHVRTGSLRSLEKTGHVAANDSGETDLGFNWNSKFWSFCLQEIFLPGHHKHFTVKSWL